MSSKGTAREIKPRGASGVIGATTTIWAQQHKQPSPEHPSSESPAVWVEKMQVSGEISGHAKISVAAKSRINRVIPCRTVGQKAIPLILPYWDVPRARVGKLLTGTEGVDAAVTHALKSAFFYDLMRFLRYCLT